MRDKFLQSLRRNWWLALAFGLVIGTVPVAYVLSPPAEVGFTGWIEAFGTVTSLLLSLILVVLYREMSITQREQNKLIQKQNRFEQRLHELEQRPTVEVRDVSVETDPDETWIVAEVANKGQSTIENLRFGIDLVLYDEAEMKIGLSTEKSVIYDGDEWIIEPRDVQFQRRGQADAAGATHLESGESATLVAPVSFEFGNMETSQTDRLSFQEVVDVLRRTRIGTVKFYGSVLYADWSDRPGGTLLDSGKAELTGFDTLDELLASERKHTKLPDDFLTAHRQRSSRWA